MSRRHAFNTPTLGLVLVVVLLVAGSLGWYCGCQRPWGGAGDTVPDHPEDLERKLNAIQASAEAKRAVAEELARGRLGLLAAAARIREIDRASPHFQWELFRMAHPDVSDDERHCREVIGWVLATYPDSTETEQRVRALEDELEWHRRDGSLRLPDGRGGWRVELPGGSP